MGFEGCNAPPTFLMNRNEVVLYFQYYAVKYQKIEKHICQFINILKKW